MRRNPTEWEKRLWRALSNRQIGFKFRRQAVFYPYICGFFCPSKGLIVEVDGDTHDPEYDANRNGRLEGKGFKVIHFTNLEVRDNVEGVIEHLLTVLKAQRDRWSGLPHPSPSPEGEGLRK